MELNARYIFCTFFSLNKAENSIIKKEIIMLFKITYSIPVENVKACQARFMTGEEKMDGLTVTGRWHEVGKSQGFLIAEAEDMIAVGKFTNQWSDLCNMDVTPIMTDKQVGQVLMA